MNLFQNFITDRYEEWLSAVTAVKVDRLLGMKAEDVVRYITCDRDEIAARQHILKDCMTHREVVDTFRQILDNIKAINGIFAKSNIYSESLEKTFYEVRIFQVYIDSIELLNKLYWEKHEALQSERLKVFLRQYHTIRESDEYGEICRYVRERIKGLENIKSVTVGINLNLALEPKEMGIVSINDQSFTCPSLFQKFFTGGESNRHMIASLVKFESDNNLLERSLYLTVNNILIKSLKRSNVAVSQWLRKNCEAMLAAFEDIGFICGCVGFLKFLEDKKATYCFPKWDETTEIKQAYAPSLLRKMSFDGVICNDSVWALDGTHMYVLTGANSGGKSVFVTTVGVCQILFQLGTAVPASEASMRTVGCVHTHFSASMEMKEGESRFTNECIKMREILGKLVEGDMLLMDETFSATSSSEGAAVAYQVLKHIKRSRCMCLYSTHIHELDHYLEKLNDGKSTVAPMHVECVNGKRTFRIVYGSPDESSYAYEIAKKYGLAFEE